MIKLLRGIKVNKSGASAAEYALIVAVLGAGVIAAASVFSTSLKNALTTSGDKITSTATTPPTP